MVLTLGFKAVGRALRVSCSLFTDICDSFSKVGKRGASGGARSLITEIFMSIKYVTMVDKNGNVI